MGLWFLSIFFLRDFSFFFFVSFRRVLERDRAQASRETQPLFPSLFPFFGFFCSLLLTLRKLDQTGWREATTIYENCGLAIFFPPFFFPPSSFFFALLPFPLFPAHLVGAKNRRGGYARLALLRIDSFSPFSPSPFSLSLSSLPSLHSKRGAKGRVHV